MEDCKDTHAGAACAERFATKPAASPSGSGIATAKAVAGNRRAPVVTFAGFSASQVVFTKG